MPSVSDDRISKLLDQIYETTTINSADSWLKVYRNLSETFSSGPGSLSFYLNDKNKFELVASTIDDESFQKYTDYYYKVSPFRRKIENMQAGEKFARSEHCSDEMFSKTEIYQDYFRHLDIFYYDYEVLFRESNISGAITFTRSKSKGNFSKADYKAMRLIMPHIRRAFKVYFRLNQINKDKFIISEVLNHIQHSVVVVNKEGKVLFANDNAKQLIQKNDGLQINRKKNLIANTSQDTKKIREVLQGIFSPDIKKKVSHSGTVQVLRPSGLKPFSILAAPLTNEFKIKANSQPVAILFITDPESKFEAAQQVLCDIYDLTPAEAKLASILVQGKSLKEAGKLLNVTDNTVRTHLKHIFSKTDTHRQGDLIRLILTGPANLTNI